jgi:hypothetical protein
MRLWSCLLLIVATADCSRSDSPRAPEEVPVARGYWDELDARRCFANWLESDRRALTGPQQALALLRDVPAETAVDLLRREIHAKRADAGLISARSAIARWQRMDDDGRAERAISYADRHGENVDLAIGLLTLRSDTLVGVAAEALGRTGDPQVLDALRAAAVALEPEVPALDNWAERPKGRQKVQQAIAALQRPSR